MSSSYTITMEFMSKSYANTNSMVIRKKNTGYYE